MPHKTMKIIYSTFIIIFLSAFNYASGAGIRIYVDTHVSYVDGCNYNQHSMLNEYIIRQWVVSDINSFGYQVVDRKSDADSGLEVKVQANVCGMSWGPLESYNAAIGVFGISNGSSSMSSTKKIAFSYNSGLASASGSPDRSQAQRMLVLSKGMIKGLITRILK
jgi:hypothetical protein